MNKPFKCLTQEQAGEVANWARKVTMSPFGPAIFLHLADEYLAHEARGDAGDFRVSRTHILEFLNNEISRAALRKLLLGFEEKQLVNLDGRYIGVSSMFIGKIPSSEAGTFGHSPRQAANVGQFPRESNKTTFESQMSDHCVSGTGGKDSILGTARQNAAWDAEEQHALKRAAEIIATRTGESTELVLDRLVGACTASPQNFLAAVCGVASAIRSLVTVDDYVSEVKNICAGKSSISAANPKTFARVHQAFAAVITDSIKREQEMRKANEQMALELWVLEEMNKNLKAQAVAASAANAAPVATANPATESITATVTNPAQATPADSAAAVHSGGVAATESGIHAPLGSVPADAVGPEASDTVKLAKIYQLPQSGDWFRAA